MTSQHHTLLTFCDPSFPAIVATDTDQATVDNNTTRQVEEERRKERQMAIEQDLVADLQRKKSEMLRRRRQAAEVHNLHLADHKS